MTLDKAILVCGSGSTSRGSVIELEDAGESFGRFRFAVRVIRAADRKMRRLPRAYFAGLVAAREVFNRVVAREMGRM